MEKVSRINVLRGKEDFLNIIQGGAFLGSGGGGPIAAGEEMLEEILKDGGEVVVISTDEIQKREDLFGAVVAFMGSPSQGTKGIDMNSPLKAFNSLELYVPNRKLDFALAIEIGAGNSMVPIMTAIKKGIVVVDSDGAGRAVPKIQNTTYALACDATPAALANGSTQETVQAEICNIINIEGIDKKDVPDKLESYALEICETEEFGGMGGLALYLLNGKQVIQNTISGTLSLTYQIGKAIRASLITDSNQLPADSLKAFLNAVGWTYFTFEKARVIEVKKPVEVKKSVIASENGLDYGYVLIEDYYNNTMKLSYVNENLFAVINDKKIWAMGPDLICYVTNNGAISNVEIEVGMEVTIFGLKAFEQMRNPIIVESFMQVLKDSGIYSGEYIKIEDLNRD